MKTQVTRPYYFTNTCSKRLVNLQSTVWITHTHTHTHTTSPWSFTQHWASRLIGYRLSLSNKERMDSYLNPVYKVSAWSVCLLNGGSTKKQALSFKLNNKQTECQMCKGRPRGLVTWLSPSARIRPQFHQPALEDFFDCVLWFNLWGEEKEGCSLTHTHPPFHLVPITPQRKRPLQCPTLPCTTEEHNWVSFSTELFHKSSLDGSRASHVHTKNNLSIDMIYIEHLTDWQKQCSWERPFCKQ